VSALARRVRNADALRQVSNVVAERLELALKLGAKVVQERAEMIDLTLQRGDRCIDVVLRNMLSGVKSTAIHTALHGLRSNVVSRVSQDVTRE
jgi:hypothetical protein